MSLADKKTIKAILSREKLWSKKSLGQNFLVDQKVLSEIIRAADLCSKDEVLEIGPGLGTLTQKLCQRTKKVIAVEKDKKLAKILEKNINDCKNLKIINADILRIKTYKLIPKIYKLVANIPYNITSPVLKEFLTGINKPKLMVLMVQREVATRICSLPGQMSILSVMVQFYSDPKIIETIEPFSFFPVPKVQSAILKIDNIQPKIEIDEKNFFRCVKIGFASRRKTLLNNLSSGYHLDKKEIKDILEKVGLIETARAQELSIADWQKLISYL
jgi:16S rRNA (adenine1518-N6/adenine1519-N6)-dimethyltransferase